MQALLSSAPCGFAARSRVLARLVSLAQIGELARRLIHTTHISKVSSEAESAILAADRGAGRGAGRLLPPNNFTAILNVPLTAYVSILNNKLSSIALTQILEHLFNYDSLKFQTGVISV